MPLIKGKSDKAFSENVSTEMHHGKPLKQSLAIAYAMKKRAKKAHGGVMCAEGCDMLHEHNYAKGGEIGCSPEEVISEDTGKVSYDDQPGHLNQRGFAEGGDVEEMEEGVNPAMSKDEPGVSYAGHHARMAKKAKEMGDEELAKRSLRNAKGIHKFRLKEELEPMRKLDRRYLANGGMSDDDEPISSPSPYEAAAASIKKALSGPPDEAAAAPEEMKEDKNPVSASMKKIFKTPGYADGGIVEIIMHKRKKMSEGGQVANDVGMGAAADLEDNQFDDLVLRDDLESSYDGANSGDELGNAGEDERRMDIVSKIMASRRKKDRLPRPA